MTTSSNSTPANTTESPELDIRASNDYHYARLVTAIRASQGVSALLIAVCDDCILRDAQIRRYDYELAPLGACLQVQLDSQEPSLTHAIRPHLPPTPALVTVLGADRLSLLPTLPTTGSDDPRSPQDRFFGYLQWTREATRDFPCPIILWVTYPLLDALTQRASDFWGWRKGVFRFRAEQRLSLPTGDRPTLPADLHDDPDLLPFTDLHRLIHELIQQRGESDPALADLYKQVGQTYASQLRQGTATDVQAADDQAQTYFRNALQIYHCTPNGDYGILSTLWELAALDYLRGRYRDALPQFAEALDRATQLQDLYWQSRCLASLGNTNHSLGQYERAIDFYQQALVISREIGDRQGEGYDLNSLGFVYKSLGQYQQAIDFYQQALVISREIGDRQGESNSLGCLGSASWILGQYQQAIDFHQQALVIFREIGDRAGESDSLNCLGLGYERLGRYEQANEFFHQSLVIKCELGDRAGESVSLCNIGWVNLLIGNYLQAIEYNQKSLAITQEIGLAHIECTTQANFGLAYCYLGQYEKALDHNQQSLDIARRIGHQYIEGFALNNLGKLYYKLDQYQVAIEFYRQAFNVGQATNDPWCESLALEGIGANFVQLENYSEALETLHKALEITQNIGYRYGEAGTRKHLAELHQALGEIETAQQDVQQALALATELGIPLKAECETLLAELGQGEEQEDE